MTRIAVWCVAGLLVAGCSEPAAPPDQAVAIPAAAATGTPSAEEPQADAGEVSFAVGGDRLAFRVASGSETSYTPVSSRIEARAPTGAGRLLIVILAVDLKSLDYPVVLPPPQRSQAAAATRLATITFGYTNAAGSRWTGAGPVRFESLEGGTLTGTFTDVALSHTGRQEPDVTLMDGTFRVRLPKLGSGTR